MKKLEIEINNCGECPYCQYDSYYNMSQTSGWDCEHPDAVRSRIINEEPNSEEGGEILSTQTPEWCPLPDIIVEKK